jgi:hypothetical protein
MPPPSSFKNTSLKTKIIDYHAKYSWDFGGKSLKHLIFPLFRLYYKYMFAAEK